MSGSGIKIGIIGGSGLNDPDIIENRTERRVTTIYGDPSDALIEGDIKGVPCILLARHGRKHSVYPTKVNFRANIWALKEAGCTHILASTACGGLQAHMKPGDLVILDQFIDRTQQRVQTFYDGEEGHPQGVLHIPMAEPFCTHTRQVFIDAAEAVGIPAHSRGCVLTIEGPRYSSRHESRLWHDWGADVINMTTVPEVILAKEAGLCYASLAMVTDYDSWKEDEPPVTVKGVLATFLANADKAKKVILAAIPIIINKDWTHIIQEKKVEIMDNMMGL